MKWMIKSSRVRTITAFVLLVVLWPTLVMALPLQEAGIVTTLSGKASVTRVSLPQTLPLHFKDPLYLGDKISTAEDSIVRVLLGGKALVTVRELSVFSITEKVGKSIVNLGHGKISLAVARQRMNQGESVEVRTPNAVAAVRGTVLVVEVEPAPTAAATPGPAVTSSTVTVIKGTVTVGTLNAPNSVTVGALQSVKVVGQTVGAVQGISPAMAAQVLKNLKAPQQFTESDEGTKKNVSKAEQAKALALAKVLMPDLFPEEEKVQEKKDERGARQEGQMPSGDGGDAALTDASSIGTQIADASADLTATTTGLLGQTTAPVVSTTLQTDVVQQIVNPLLPPPPTASLVIPPDQPIDINQTFVDATHTSGILGGTGTVTVTGLYDWLGGTMNDTGITEAQGGLALGGDVTLDRTLNISGTSQIQGDFTISGTGVLANAGTLTKTSGTGTATINPTFNNTGTVAVNSGTLAINGGGTSSGSFAVASGSTLNFSGDPYAVSGVVSGAGALAVSGGLVTLSGANTYSGGTTVSGGVLEGTTTSLQGAITDNATVRFNQTTTGTYAGVLSGTGALEMSGTGTVTLSGANTYTGGTTVSGGVLEGTTTSLQGAITDNAAVRFNQSGSGAYTGVLSGTGTLEKSGTGTVTLTGANTYGGGTSITGGTLQSGAAGVLPDATAVTVTTPGVLDLNSFNETIGSLAGSGNVTLGNATLTAGGNNGTTTYSGVISGTGGLTKAGTGTLTLSGANTYAGTTTISDGTLRLTNASGLGTTAAGTAVAAAGTLELGGVAVGTEAVTLNGGVLRGTGTASLAGTLTLGADSTVTVATGGDVLTLNGVIGDGGNGFGLTKTGAGTLALDNTGFIYRLSGTTAVSGGTLSTTGDLVSMQTGETLTIADTMLNANGGVIDVDKSVIRVPFTADPVGIVQANGTNPLVLLTNNTHTIATSTGSAMFDIAGNPANTTTESIHFGLPSPLGEDVTLTLGTDRPITGNDVPLAASLLEMSGATVNGEQLLKVDTALLEATVPLLKVLAGSTLTFNADAVNLTQMAKLLIGANVAMIELNGASLTVNVGALANAAGGSYLNVMGDLIRLSNSATLTLASATDGFLIRASGNSVVDIVGALIDFGTGNNKVQLANTYNNPLETFLDPLLGFRVRLLGGALASQVEILRSPIQGSGAITDLVGQAFTGSLIEVDGRNARVRIGGN
jgi:autotransporter-associated beta strand protein